MNNNNNVVNTLILGSTIGTSQIIIGYPLDTLKTLRQNNKKITSKELKFRRIYKGISYPIYLNIFYQSLLFYSYENLNNKLNNHLISGFITGGIIGTISNPFEYYKVREQNKLPIKHFSRNSFLKGLQYTILRESIATGIYFSSYYTLKEYNINTFISGGLSGVFSWVFTYPIDTIKTRIQSCDALIPNKYHNIGFSSCLFNKNLFNGMSYCLSRSFIVNSFTFIIYEYLKKNNINCY